MSDDKALETTLPDLQSRPSASHLFQKGNQLWRKSLENRNRLGRFPDAQTVIELFCEYMQWCEENPLYESKLVTYEGSSNLEEVPKMRTPSLAGLCAFMGIHRDTWGAWRRGDYRPDLRTAVEWGEQIMHESKLSGAAAGLLHPVIICRDLGLADRSVVDNKTRVVIEGDEADL